MNGPMKSDYVGNVLSGSPHEEPAILFKIKLEFYAGLGGTSLMIDRWVFLKITESDLIVLSKWIVDAGYRSFLSVFSYIRK